MKSNLNFWCRKGTTRITTLKALPRCVWERESWFTTRRWQPRYANLQQPKVAATSFSMNRLELKVENWDPGKKLFNNWNVFNRRRRKKLEVFFSTIWQKVDVRDSFFAFFYFHKNLIWDPLWDSGGRKIFINIFIMFETGYLLRNLLPRQPTLASASKSLFYLMMKNQIYEKTFRGVLRRQRRRRRRRSESRSDDSRATFTNTTHRKLPRVLHFKIVIKRTSHAWRFPLLENEPYHTVLKI